MRCFFLYSHMCSWAWFRDMIKLLWNSILFSGLVFNNCQVGPDTGRRDNDSPLLNEMHLGTLPAAPWTCVSTSQFSLIISAASFPSLGYFLHAHMWLALRWILMSVVSVIHSLCCSLLSVLFSSGLSWVLALPLTGLSPPMSQPVSSLSRSLS